jgi:hypothetical protein
MLAAVAGRAGRGWEVPRALRGVWGEGVRRATGRPARGGIGSIVNEAKAAEFDAMFRDESFRKALGSKRAVPLQHVEAAAGRDEEFAMGAARTLSDSTAMFRQRLEKARLVQRSGQLQSLSAAAASSSSPPRTIHAMSKPPSPPSAPTAPLPSERPPQNKYSGLEPLNEGETLLFHAPTPTMQVLGSTLGVVPALFSATSLALNVAGYGVAMPNWGIALGFGSSAIAFAMMRVMLGRTISSIVALPGGTHLRIRTVSPFSAVFGKNETVIPVPFLQHRHGTTASTIVLTIGPPNVSAAKSGTLFLPMDSSTTIPDDALFHAAVAGRAPLAVPNAVKNADDAYWKQGVTDGKPYWWNEVTRQTQWNKPSGAQS